MFLEPKFVRGMRKIAEPVQKFKIHSGLSSVYTTFAIELETLDYMGAKSVQQRTSDRRQVR